MAGNTIGKVFRVTTFGESHGEALGVVIDGCLPGLTLTKEEIQKEVDRRRPSAGKITTARKEEDRIEVLSGIFEGKTTGMPITIIVRNEEMKSKDYGNLKDLFRPGHADYTYEIKYGIRDYRGGGRSSGRETVCRVMAGAVAKKILAGINSREKTRIFGHTLQVGEVRAEKFHETEIEKNIMRCADEKIAKKMIEYIEKLRDKGDSSGSLIEIIVRNPPPGIGEPVFDKLNADLGKALLSIPTIKGVSFGKGFKVVTMKGSENNDEFLHTKGRIRTKTNNAGGTLGGISSGEDIVIDIAVKPPSSIAKKQQTVNKKGQKIDLEIKGRHDACLAPRIIPVAESMVAIILVDHFLRQKQYRKE